MKPLSIALFICGVVHCLPLVGLLGSSWLQKLYGVEDMSHNLVLLMQHRALMFGLLGSLFIYATWQPGLQLFASVVGMISMVGFIMLVGFDNPEPRLHKVVMVDCGVLFLLVTTLLWRLRHHPH